MKSRKSGGVWFSAGLALILIALCTVVSIAAIQFVGIPLLQATLSSAPINTAQQVAEPTATYGPDEDPPPRLFLQGL